jgi:hypothetical protein
MGPSPYERNMAPWTCYVKVIIADRNTNERIEKIVEFFPLILRSSLGIVFAEIVIVERFIKTNEYCFQDHRETFDVP